MEEKIAENLVQLVALGTLSLFTFFGGVLLFIILYQKKVIKSEREKQNLETEYQKELLHINIETQEKERARIAADLHDGIGAALAAVRLMINQVKPETDKNEELLKDCKVAIQKTADSAREISHDLLPPSLEALGLSKILTRMCKNLSSDELKLSYESNVKSKFNSRKELALFRIVQEMLNNTVKHANASAIKMELTFSNNEYIFNFSDNGKGFNTEKSEGLGFRNIITRLQMIQAEHEFYSFPHKDSGVKIFFSDED